MMGTNYLPIVILCIYCAVEFSFDTSYVFGYQFGVNVKVKIIILTASYPSKRSLLTANKTVFGT